MRIQLQPHSGGLRRVCKIPDRAMRVPPNAPVPNPLPLPGGRAVDRTVRLRADWALTSERLSQSPCVAPHRAGDVVVPDCSTSRSRTGSTIFSPTSTAICVVRKSIDFSKREGLTTIPLPPPVCPFGTFFLLRSVVAGTPQNAGLSAHLSEPRGRAPEPILGHSLSLFGPFLRRNRTTAILVRMLEARRINKLHEATRDVGSKEPRLGGVERESKRLGSSVNNRAQVQAQPSSPGRRDHSNSRFWKPLGRSAAISITTISSAGSGRTAAIWHRGFAVVPLSSERTREPVAACTDAAIPGMPSSLIRRLLAASSTGSGFRQAAFAVAGRRA